jgi:MFS family permease
MKTITRTIWILSLVSLLADIASEMLYPVVPLYLKEIGFSVALIGLLEGIAEFTAGLSKGYFGKRSDEKGLRLPFIKLGYLLSAVGKSMMGLLSFQVWVFLARTTDRLGKGVRTAARDALLSQEATPETKGRVFGFHRSLDTIGATIGPVLALVFLYFYPGDYKTIFLLAFIPGILAVLLIFLLKEKKQQASTLGKGHFFSFLKYWRIASPAYKKLVTGLLLFTAFNSSDFFLLLKTKEAIGNDVVFINGLELGADTLTILAYIFYNLVYAAFSYPAGFLSDRWGMKKVFLTGLLLFAAVYAGFAFNPSVPVIFLLFFIYGIFSATTEGVAKAWITNMAHQTNTATAVGFYTSLQSVCALFASLTAGLLWDYTSSNFVFLLTASTTVISLLFLLLKVRTQKSSVL